MFVKITGRKSRQQSRKLKKYRNEVRAISFIYLYILDELEIFNDFNTSIKIEICLLYL